MRPEVMVSRTVKASVVPGGQPDDDGYGPPGQCCCVGMEAYKDHLVFNCPGCGRRGSIRAYPGEKRPDGWQITAGSLDDPTTLSLHPSIHCVGCCGWHGFLTNGEFKSA